MKAIDYNTLINYQNEPIEKTTLTCYVVLSKEIILQTLAYDSIFINGKNYKVPEVQLLDCIYNKKYENIRLELEEIK